MPESVADRLAALGLTLPEVPAPLANYVPATLSGSWVLTSGQLPLADGELLHRGIVGTDVSVDDAVACARQSAVNTLAAVASVVDLEIVRRVVKVTVFVASGPEFTGQPQVANGASELYGQVFGEAGRHVRSAVGVASLPIGAPTEVELIAEIG